ncbi:hypothetical protein F183_A00520 [Bryobacterales bacterium F-183]|nr:hypothetical protein F183_A00520 [Bryobacterales bacterium F-183]
MTSAFRRNTVFAAVLACIALATAPLVAQTSGSIRGSVIDPAGAAIPGAKVDLSLAGSDAVIASVTTKEDGVYSFLSLRPAVYKITITASGFAKEAIANVKVDTARETSLPATKVSVSSTSETIEVSAAVTTVQTNNAEISSTVTNAQIAKLPQLNRSPLALIATQAGVGSNGRTGTTINGLRVTYSNVTIDGINIQDNFIRTNALDFLPNMVLTDQVGEMTIATSNTNASQGNGVGQVAFITPSGTNSLHGSAYWYNRNNKFAANNWFNNRDGVALPFLNQNQFGGSLGGPIKKDKLFYYFNAEGLRLRQQSSVNRTILTDDARRGIFTYVAGGETRKVNLLTATGQSADSEMAKVLGLMPTGSAINNFRVGDSTETLLRNTAGYSFVRRSNRSRENVTAKADYYLNEKNSFAGSYIWNRDIVDRPTVTATGFTPVGAITNSDKRNLVSGTWRWTPSATLTNELRGGFNFAPASFISSDPQPAYFVGGLLFSNPVETLLPQGRNVKTYNFLDTANWVKGKHQISFGAQLQFIRVRSYNDAGIVPTYNLGINTNQRGVSTAELPGAAAADITNANTLLSNIAGLLNTASRTFNVADRNSGFVPGQSNVRNQTNDSFAFFGQDSWRVRRGLTLNMGVRWEYFARINETNGLYLTPVATNGNALTSLLTPTSTLDFAGSAAGRPLYNRDMNNFAPNIGLVWDVRGDGKTAVRMGYSMNYVNDSHIRSIQNAVETNSGLSLGRTDTALRGALAARPEVSQPAYKVPRTFQDNFLLNPTGAFGTVNPNLVTPYVQQWNFSIQRQIGGGVLEARYVGNKGTKLFRSFDYNQININERGFLEDFRRAQANGIASQNAGLGFNPAYQGPGTQPLTVFPLIGLGGANAGGALTNATVRNFIQTGEVAELANFYNTNSLAGARSTSPVNFFRNPFGIAANMLNNYSNSTYNAFQVDYSKRFASGFQFQANYTFSKGLSDTDGTGQTSFEAFLDANNAQLEKTITSFNVPHSFKTNFVFELPFGRGRKFLSGANGLTNRIVSGWSIASLMQYQSGNPFSIFSERATLNRAARSTSNNTASTTLTMDQLSSIVTPRMAGNGPYIISAGALGTDGRGTSADGTAPFSGQAFFNPAAGTLGSLARRVFTGPTWFNADFSLAKTVPITESHRVELRMDAFNAFNNAFFYSGDQFINSPTFGRMTSTQNNPRVLQFGLHYRF